MTLGEWLKANKKTQAWLAAKLKSNQGHVSRLVTGVQSPRMTTIAKLEVITGGKVGWPWPDKERGFAQVLKKRRKG